MTVQSGDRSIVPIEQCAQRLSVGVITAAVGNHSMVHRNRTDLIVLHCTDGHEGGDDAENSAAEFTRELKRPRSYHYACDSNSVVCSVPENLIAWHCGRTGNLRSVSVELCGRASQTRAQWYDDASLATMRIGVRLCADIARRHQLPAVYVGPEGLLNGERGITTHAAVSLAWKQSKHTDPGPAFPLREFVAGVHLALAQLGNV
jgi:N-acetylmuramoyl-L-alanine amidase CwlA